MAEPRRSKRPPRRDTTRRVLTGGEIRQEHSRAVARELGLTPASGDPSERPMRSTADMVTPADVRRQVRRDMGRT